MRLMTWNVNARKGKLGAQVERCVSLDPDVVCLQEVTKATIPRWRRELETRGYDVRDSLSVAADPDSLTGRRKYCVLIATRLAIASDSIAQIDGPWPERTLSIEVDLGGEAVEVHCVHLPAGAPDRQSGGHFKSETFEAIAARMRAAGSWHRVLCGDFNSPQEELDDGRIVCFGSRVNAAGEIVAKRSERFRRQKAAEESVIAFPERIGLRDCYRGAHGVDHGGYSFVQRRSGKAWRRRFDHVMASPALATREARYDTEGLEAGLSDHAALVVGTH